MRSEISEFSYGFVLAAELRDLFRPWVIAAPYFPTLRDEAELGWDLKLSLTGGFLFLQFKVAEVLVRQNAAEWHHYLASYFRFPLHRLSQSSQHNRLRTLAQTEPFVFYVGPRFHRLEEFNTHYLDEVVVQESAWIPLSSLPEITDDQQHHITYLTGMDVRFGSPESEEVGRTFDGERWQTYVAHQLEQPVKLTVESIRGVRDKLLSVLRRTPMAFTPALPERTGEPRAETVAILRDISYLSRTFFGAEFLLIRGQS